MRGSGRWQRQLRQASVSETRKSSKAPAKQCGLAALTLSPYHPSLRRLLPRHASSPSSHQQANMTSSDQIPNLRTLLGPGRGGGLRGRARGRGGPGSSSDEARDNAVKGTDQDAAGSRVSCVELGYLHDPYAKLFAIQPSTRRLPLLNRGMQPAISLPAR